MQLQLLKAVIRFMSHTGQVLMTEGNESVQLKIKGLQGKMWSGLVIFVVITPPHIKQAAHLCSKCFIYACCFFNLSCRVYHDCAESMLPGTARTFYIQCHEQKLFCHSNVRMKTSSCCVRCLIRRYVSNSSAWYLLHATASAMENDLYLACLTWMQIAIQ